MPTDCGFVTRNALSHQQPIRIDGGCHKYPFRSCPLGENDGVRLEIIAPLHPDLFDLAAFHGSNLLAGLLDDSEITLVGRLSAAGNRWMSLREVALESDK